MKSKFKAHLQGHPFDLEEVKRLFEPAGYVVDRTDNGNWFIGGGDLATCFTPKEVRIVTSQLVKDANSVLTLANGDYRHVHASGDIIENDKYFHTAIEIPSAEVRVKGQVELRVTQQSRRSHHFE